MPLKTNWESSFRVGNDTLDDQHRRLLEICNRLAECIEKEGRSSDEQFHEVLNELALYGKEHFITEEHLLSKLNYPFLADQLAEHTVYDEKLADVLIAAVHGKLEKIELQRYLTHWWVDHILGSDMLYKPFLEIASQSNNISPVA
jgi:hemerythrin-like metal-binding protein